MKESNNNKYLLECLNKNSIINELISMKKSIYLSATISDIAVFNSGNIICATFDGFFLIYNTNFEIIQNQKIEKIEDQIYSIGIKSESVIYFGYQKGDIEIWIINHENFLFEKKKEINCHKGIIYKLLLFQEYFFTCSNDNTIKKWDIKNNYCVCELNQKNNYLHGEIYSIIYNTQLKILVSSGNNGTFIFYEDDNEKFEKLTNEEINKMEISFKSSLQLFDENNNFVKIIIGNKIIIIFSISKQLKIQINYRIKNIDYVCLSICVLKFEEKIIFLTSEMKNDENEKHKIKFYQKSGKEYLIYKERESHKKNITGIIEYPNIINTYISFSNDNYIKIWGLN